MPQSNATPATEVKSRPFEGSGVADWQPGMLRREDHGSGHHYVCPCGCQRLYYAEHAVVSGSAERGDLTLTPSLWHNGKGGCGWHGWLQGGVFRTA